VRKSIELRQERTQLLNGANQIAAKVKTEKRFLTDQEKGDFESACSRAQILEQEIRMAEKEEDEERNRFEGRITTSSQTGPRIRRETQVDDAPLFAITTGGESIRTLAPAETLRSVIPNDLPDNARASEFSWGRAIRGIVNGNWKGSELEKRALFGGHGAAGGYLIPETLAAEFIDLARNQSVIFNAGARTLPMPTPDVLLARLVNDPTAVWRGEGVEITEDTTMEFGAFKLSAKKLACLITASVELVEDSANIDSIVRNAISQALALKLDYAALEGTGGPIEVQGIIGWVGQTPGVQIVEPGGNGAAIEDYDDFSAAVEKVLTKNGKADVLIMAPRTFGAVDRLKEATTNAPLAPPASFKALRQLVSNQVPINLIYGTATNASHAFVGDFSGVLVGMRTDMRLEVSREAGDSFKKGQVQIRAYLRADVLPTNPEHICVIAGIIPAA